MARRDSRLPAKLRVAFRTQGAFLVAYSINLSKGGIFLETPDLLEVGTELILRIEIPDTGELELHGAVAWVRAASGDGLPDGMGVQLRQVDETYGATVDRLVQAFTGITVLILAANTDRLTQLSRYVRSIMSCEVLEATSLAEAATALSAQPDVVLLELAGGSEFGLKTIEIVKKQQLGTPVILLASNPRTREFGRTAGADEVMESPPSFAALQAAVIRTLCRPAKVAT